MEETLSVRRLLLAILTIGLAAGQESKMKYLVVSPAVLPYPSNQTVCVYVFLPDPNTKMVISLTAQTSSLFTTHINEGDEQIQCNTLQVPPPVNGKDEIATISVDITSDGLKEKAEKSVIIRPMRSKMFVQTDRAMYQPGETLIMRAVDYTEDLMAKNEMFSWVNFTDNQGNIIKRWQNIQTKGGILELSYNLSLESRVGDYTVTASKNGSMAHVTVTIDKLVLPKFETTINAPEEVTIHQSNFPMKICSKYTYNKPVRGNITGKMCREALFSPDHLCKPIDGQTDAYGCYTTEVDTDFFKLKYDDYSKYIDVEATLTEDGTGVERKDTKHITVTSVIAKVVFKDPRDVYRPGLQYRGWMTVTGPDGRPMADADIELYVNGERREEIYTTNNDGSGGFTLEHETLHEDVIHLQAKLIPRQPLEDNVDSAEVEPEYEDGYATLIRFYTRVVSQVKIRKDLYVLPCNKKVNLWADYVLDPKEYKKETINFHYMIFKIGQIVSSASIRHTFSPNGGMASFFPVPVMVNSDMSPAATIFIFAGLDNGDIIADSIKIPVTSCYPNPVSLQFSEKQNLPGSSVNLHISAYPNSICSIRAVDKSAELLKAEEKRSEDAVNENLSQWDIHDYPEGIEELQKCPPGSSPAPVEASEKPDTYSLLKDSGIKSLSNFLTRKPPKCQNVTFYRALTFSEVAEIPPPGAKVRRRFPRTWFMSIISVGSTGHLDYPLRMPDTITQWDTDGFCTSAVGLGFSPLTSIQTFQPMSLEMIIPYSVKQGEILPLKGIALNFMRQCIKVQATLYRSKDFQVEPCDGCPYTACLCSDPTYTFIWNIRPLTLGALNITIGIEALSTSDLCDGQQPIVPPKGHSDIVQRRLIVEPNGVPVEDIHSARLCFNDLLKIPVDLPDNAVLGSQSAQVTVTGDIMGKPLDNLDNLVKLPKGCGEQRMMIFATIISILSYYSTNGHLTDETLQKGKQLLETSFQTQLNYRHEDGSYSAFGDIDIIGSTWLTAFVAKGFSWGKKFIDIDDKQITDPLDWLRRHQLSNGCFKNLGRLFQREVQGGVDNEMSLAAYVLSSFLEVGDPQYNDVIEKAKQCLEGCTAPDSSTYTKALCAYTYTLMGNSGKRKQLLDQLDQVAIRKGNSTHWSKNSQIPKDDPLWPKPNAVDVETTGYVVLAYASGDDPTETDLQKAARAVNWFTTQQNANGGFASTQDTVVALQAISTYDSLTFVDENLPTVTITNDKGFHVNVTANRQKPSEVQVVKLPDIPANYILKGSGKSGCANVQIIKRYNILNPEPEGTFSLVVNTSPIECPPHPEPSFTLDIIVSLSSASKIAESNMAIIVIKMISGFVPVDKNRVLHNSSVKKVEDDPTSVTIYFEKIDSTPTEISLEFKQQSEVQNLQPAVVFVKDYYTPSQWLLTQARQEMLVYGSKDIVSGETKVRTGRVHVSQYSEKRSGQVAQGQYGYLAEERAGRTDSES
ncbi:alpha-2-macroglobulin-like protein 1 [Leptodactylus fuscus]|uniref:alpha-2-macroglobulin-like protein 1 n=1 Tax=Leptodactylus fuscus TaxID=238119 RepID=UPI003F4EFF8B